MVSRHSATYLLAHVDGFEDLRQFALHRVKHAAFSQRAWQARDDFDIDHYIQGGAFGYLQGKVPVTLIAHIAPQVAWLLSETPLSETQRLTPLPDSNWQQLEAEVPDDQQTLWWLMGMSTNVKVLAPRAWRKTLKANAAQVLAHYQDTLDTCDTH
jgi:predicted DNA-binding transcriptional regulator YafY